MWQNLGLKASFQALNDIIVLIMLVCLHFISSFSIISDSICFSFILETAHAKCNLVFSYSSVVLYFKSQLCCVFKAMLPLQDLSLFH